MDKKEEKNLLAAYYGNNAFVKIKQCLEIGKIQFSFVDKTNTKEHIDCYMEAEEFGAILMAGIKNGSLIKALVAEKEKGEQYPKAVWTSPVGGNATGNNGSPVSRYFDIAPASKGEVLFTAYAFPAEKNETGAFIKVKGSKALLTLRIPCTYNDLKILQYKWSFLEADYMSNKYTFENMKSDRQPKCEDTYSSTPIDSYESVSEEIPQEEEVPFVGSENTPKQEEPKKAVAEVVKLIAKSELTAVPNKNNIKVCNVDLNGTERQLIWLTDKFVDKAKLSQFEEQLKLRVLANKTLEFRAEVCSKGDNLYICKFA